jgi:chemosensory pili system protein ChpE/L-lysine exporter family protein LysE/ArgO
MLMLLLFALGLGLLFNATPGPVFAETIRRGIRGGFRPALAVQIGSLAGDALWAVLGLAGVGLLLRLDSLRLPIGVAGAVYLLWLAWEAWRASKQEFSVAVADDETEHRKALRSGVMLSLTNPQNLAFWAAIGTALGTFGIREPTPWDYALFFIGFMTSSILWAFLFAGMVDRILRRAGARWARITYRLCALAFLTLALSSLRDLWIGSHPMRAIETPSTITGKP